MDFQRATERRDDSPESGIVTPLSRNGYTDLSLLFTCLADFQRDIQECSDTRAILALTQNYLERLRLFDAVAFYLVDGPSWDFKLQWVSPASHREVLENFVQASIRQGTFAWALRQSRTLEIKGKNVGSEGRLFLHSMGTRFHTHGMFVGWLKSEDPNALHYLPLNLLSILLVSSAYAMENQRLHLAIRRHNQNLQETIELRTRELVEANRALKQEISERQRSQEDLAQEKELLSTTLRSIADGVIATDLEGKVRLFNSSAQRLLGLGNEDFRGQLLREVFSISQAQTGRPIEDLVGQVLQSGTPLDVQQAILHQARQKAERLTAFSASPIGTEPGQRFGVIVVFRDITAHEKLASEMLKASKLESLGILAGGIAHDFHNILTSIIGNLSLSTRYPQDAKALSWMDNAMKASLRAKDLTQQLLTFAKGGEPIKKAALLPELIIESAQFGLHGSNIHVVFELPDNLWAAEADTGQISQVIQNIVINSVQAMPVGGNLYISASNVVVEEEKSLPLPPGRYVQIRVRDEGIGIPPKLLSRIFDPFFTTKQHGSGLGLATCYSIIKKHRGHISVASVPGEGSTFDIHLPAAQEKPRETKPQRKLQLFEGHGRILVMEDEPDLQLFLQAMLQRLGYSVEVVGEGATAVERLVEGLESEKPFDAAILDLTIRGGLGGKETIGLLRNHQPGIKAIVSSGYSNDPVMAEFEKHGFDASVSKPYQVEELARALHDLIGERSHNP